MADILERLYASVERLYASGGTTEAFEQAAAELEDAAEDCGPAD